MGRERREEGGEIGQEVEEFGDDAAADFRQDAGERPEDEGEPGERNGTKQRRPAALAFRDGPRCGCYLAIRHPLGLIGVPRARSLATGCRIAEMRWRWQGGSRP